MALTILDKKKREVVIEYNDIGKLIDKYIDNGGTYIELYEGVLGYGTIILCDNTGKLKQFVIQEKYLNEWSSYHTITTYNKRGLPKKYEKDLEEQGFYRNIDYR